MRYMVQRVGTNEWLDKNLPLEEVTRTEELSGPGVLTGRVEPELRDQIANDGFRVLEDYASLVYAVDEDTGEIGSCGLVIPPTPHEETGMNLTAPGLSAYPQGYLFSDSRLWGVQVDPIVVYRDLWDWVQAQPQSDLGVQVVGTEFSSVRIGDNEEPYRLEWFELPDVGAEMDTLVGLTPFDYVHEHVWADDAQEVAEHRIRIGHPRLGRARDDLRFAQGENISGAVQASTSEEYANDVIGIGNGEGAEMIVSRAAVDDGRLRRTRTITDKTIKNQDHLDDLTRRELLRVSPTLDLSEVTVEDHPNAPLGSFLLGDDILVETWLPTYGDIRLWVRVLAITVADTDPGYATLAVQRSSAFLYSPTVEVSS